jgi:heterodisulfide reductase subunit A-like polyferredoxin
MRARERSKKARRAHDTGAARALGLTQRAETSIGEIRMPELPILIVGGGPVGLTASILLSQHGVRSLLVERHPGTAILPKARGINARTMEM